jgi:deoxyribose-phosphate aldolase
MSLRVVDSSAKPGKSAAPPARNPGFPLDLDWVGRVRMNRSALERRAGSIGARRTVKKEWQAAWLLKAITLMDLTTLNSDDTPGRVERLCAKARHPVRQDILEGLGVGDLNVKPAAVCVYHAFVKTAVDALKGTGINVAAVSTAFPHGLAPLSTRLAEIEASVADGANEIDIVIERGMVLRGDWQALYDESLAGLHAGWRRFHQDLDRQGEGQRRPPDVAVDGPHDPLVPRRNWHRDRLQAGRRYRHG